MPSSTHSQNQWNCCHYLRRLFDIHSSINQAPQCKYEWISVKGMSDLNVYCSTTHAGENCSVVLDLTSPLLYYERAKHVYSTEGEWWSLSNSTVGEVCHFFFQPIFHATYTIVHNERSSSWLLHSHISPSNHSSVIQSVLILSHHVDVLNDSIA